jgi:branched-chain amino acid transport system ATP-binding protein
VQYGPVRALKAVNLSVIEGEIVALLGANGAGKTTTLRAISGMVKVAGGAIRFDGLDITGLSPHEIVAQGISQVPEGRRIFPDMSVQENLVMGAYLRRSSPEEIDSVLKLFPELKDRRSQAGGTLSGGEQQMLAMARALMARPRLVLLDEPSMGLAPMLVLRVFDIIRDIRDRGTTVLLVEQNAMQALRVADRGYVLEVGSVTVAGTAGALLSDERVRAAYLGGP